MTIKTPELDKERAVRDKAQAIGEFLEWLGQEGIVLCAQRPTVLGLDVEYHPVDPNPTKLLARHFGIDLRKSDEERRAILAELAGRT